MLRVALLAATAGAHVGGSCGGGGGSGGSPPVVQVSSPDERCAALSGPFPPGLAFVPGAPSRLLVANFTPSSLVPLDVTATPPRVASAAGVPALPPDSDGDGAPDDALGLGLAPRLDGVTPLSPSLALVTASQLDEVLFVDPATGGLVPLRIEVPASLPPGTFRFLPAPGTSALRTAARTFACIDVPPGARDSRGQPVVGVGFCAPRFTTSFTSGAAFIGGRVFVSMSDVGDDPGTANTQFLPGVVLVFDLDLGVVPPVLRPNATRHAIVTTAFNPTEVTPYRTPGGRDFVLVTDSGALGIVQDDPATPLPDSGGLPLTPSAIDVIDAQTLELVATVPLGLAAASFDELAIDPSGRVAFTGSAASRSLFGIDLAPLDALPPLAPGAPPFVLDGSDARVGGADARIFDAARPLTVPARADGAPVQSCPGFIVGAAFDAAGTALFATDFCDGTLTSVGVDLAGAPPTPVPRARFRVQGSTNVVSPVGAAALGTARALGSIAVRPGRPGVDYRGPDVFVLVGTPEGLVCGLNVESF